MKWIVYILRLGNIMSIDIAIGAAFSVLFFDGNRMLKSELAINAVVLALVVWVIYTADHLLDAMRLKKPAVSYRHQFHQRYFIEISIAFFNVLAIIGVLLFFVNVELLYWGLFTLILVVIYFFLRNSFPLIKEIGISVIFCMGVFLPAWLQENPIKTILFQWHTPVFFLIVLTNVVLFSYFECAMDNQDGVLTLAVRYGRKKTRKILYALFCLILVLVAYGLYATKSYDVFFTLSLMGIMLFMPFIFPSVFIKNERYRLIGDGIFMLPIIPYLWRAI